VQQLNLTIRREFPLYERDQLQFRPAFADPSGLLQSTNVGYSSLNAGLNPPYQIGGPRSIQLALRLVL
jgi:hypothetical protein